MRSFASLLSLIFTMIFFIQSSAWATGATTPYTNENIEKMVAKYNALSAEQKRFEIQNFMKARPDSDKKFLESWLKQSPSILPQMIAEKERIVVVVEGKTFKFMPKSEYIMAINGQDFDFGPGKLQATAEQIDKFISKPGFSMMNFIIDSAYAAGPLVAVILTVLAAIALVGFLHGITYFFSDEKKLKEYCSEAKNKIDELAGSGTQEDFKEAEYLIKRTLSELNQNEDCSDNVHKKVYEYCTTLSQQDRVATQTCQRTRKYVTCTETKACLNNLMVEVQSRTSAINDSERGEIKEISNPRPVKSVPASSSSQQ